MRKRIGLYGIKKKIFYYMALLLMGTITLICICTEFIVNKNVKESTVSQYSSITENVYHAFDKLYHELNAVTEQVITDPYVQKSLTNQKMDSYNADMLRKSLSLIHDNTLSYYLYMDNKGNMYSQKTVHLKAEDIYNSALYSGLGERYSTTRLLWESDVLFGNGDKAMFVGRYVRNMDILADPGVVYFRLQDDFFDRLLSQIEDRTPFFMLISDQNEICCHTFEGDEQYNIDIQNKILKELSSEVTKVQDNYYICMKDGLLCAKRHEASGYIIASFVPEARIAKMSREIMFMILVIAVMAFILAIMISIYLSNKISNPIRYIDNKMTHFSKESISDRIVIQTGTELDEIGNSYNKMLELIDNLMQEVRETEQELHESEMKSLLYQIHPHFLYNTLDNIYMLARINKQTMIMHMIESLTTYLRVTLSNGAEKITIEDELRHVAAYMEIQKIRNDNLFEYHIQCERELESIRIIKLIMQPIVENCIKHSFENMEEGGQIEISVYTKNNKLIFEVRNNGNFDKEKIKKLTDIEERATEEKVAESEKQKGGYGILNVVRRLKLQYGESSRLYYIMSDEWMSCIIEMDRERLD